MCLGAGLLMAVVIVVGGTWLVRRHKATLHFRALIEVRYATQIERLTQVARDFEQYHTDGRLLAGRKAQDDQLYADPLILDATVRSNTNQGCPSFKQSGIYRQRFVLSASASEDGVVNLGTAELDDGSKMEILDYRRLVVDKTGVKRTIVLVLDRTLLDHEAANPPPPPTALKGPLRNMNPA